ncbi:MAG: ribosomal-protein-alanine acetyltransferase [Deltaproteobacteria bacterium]|nr:ribosomal-protein-alanine acetyltransferase [Deltaproteobacteria bacterium]|tara:strand:- start:437 stop:850 length:414 start_codon:yes stop_codon:yes gene_type:complete
MTPDQMRELHLTTRDNTRVWTAQEYRTVINDPSAILFSGENGFAVGRVVHDEAELLMIIVKHDQQLRGFGRGYLHGFEMECHKRGAKTCFLEVAANNNTAKSLYYSSGYQQTGTRKLYYHMNNNQRLDALIFKKNLV